MHFKQQIYLELLVKVVFDRILRYMLPTGEFEVMIIMCVMSPARKQKRLLETFTKGVGDEFPKL